MKTILWNTDTQQDFMNPDGALYVPGAKKIKPKLKEITEFAKLHNITVVNTADCHNSESKEISDNPNFKTTFPPHCMITSPGMDFIEETYPKGKEDNYSMVCYTDRELHHSFDRARNIIIYKDNFDVFSNPLTNKVIERLKPDQVIVYGVTTEICVNYAVLGLANHPERAIKVYVVEDAIKGLSKNALDTVLAEWEFANIDVLSWKELTTPIIGTKQIDKNLNTEFHKQQKANYPNSYPPERGSKC